MAKAILHVPQQAIKKGEPALIVRSYKNSQHFSRIEVNGPSVLVHSAEPDRCGARVWIEADTADLVCDGKPYSMDKS
jgi:hypothetical protein